MRYKATIPRLKNNNKGGRIFPAGINSNVHKLTNPTAVRAMAILG
jgi:hypothetical protein